MNLFAVKRQVQLYDYLANFNSLNQQFVDATWLAAEVKVAQFGEYSLEVKDLNSMPSCLLILPQQKFLPLLKLTVLFLLFADKSLVLAGKKLSYLVTQFSPELINQGRNLSIQATLSPLGMELLKDKHWFYLSSMLILQKALNVTMNSKFEQCLLFKFDRNLVIPQLWREYWHPVTLDAVLTALAAACQFRCANFYKLWQVKGVEKSLI